MSERDDQDVPDRREQRPVRSLSDIVGEAVELPVAARGAFLRSVCEGDAALLARATALIASHDRAARAGFFAQPTGESEALGGAEVVREGERVGPYTLGACVGAGGFGVVFEATQEEPIKRRVAIKLLRAGVATPQVVARFDSERRALAMMEHPGIAKVLDAGATADGTPYFVMEFVEGEPLVAFCDRHRLALRERIELIVQVCRALQHAHAKGLIHRDLKPANILATMQDGRPCARIIDFGIAKAIEHVAAARGAFTGARQMIGTPEYMSPEQAGAAPDIDTRSDIYSIGVVLYEMLAGVSPFDAEKLRQAAFAELERVLREDDPPRPSTRLSSLEGSPASTTRLADIAATRRIDARSLMRELRGELDWIVLRCLEKDRGRRYETAAALGDDLERYLRNEPVVAKPRSGGYAARKFARRHRVGLVAAAVALASLLVGLTASLVALGQAREAQRAAESARREESEQRERAEREAVKARKAAEFLRDVLSSADPERGGRDMTVAATLRDAVALLDGGELRDQPEVEAMARHALGMSFNASNLLADGDVQLRKAIELSGVPGFDPIERASCLGSMAVTLWQQEKFASAETMLREAVELTRPFPEGRGASVHAASLRTLSSVLFFQDKRAESKEVFEQARSALLRVVGPDSTEYADLMTSHASRLHSGMRDTQPLRDAIAAHKRRYGDFHPRVSRLLVMLGTTNRFLGDLPGMVGPLEEGLAIQQKLYGADSFQAASTMHQLGEGYFNFRAFDEAEYWCGRALVGARSAQVGPASPLLVRVHEVLGNVDRMRGHLDAAATHFRDAMDAGINGGAEMLPYQRYNGAADLAGTLIAAGRFDEAAVVTDRLEAERPQVDSSLSIALIMDSVIAITKGRRGEFAEAESLLRNAVEKLDAMPLLRNSVDRLFVIQRLIAFYEHWESVAPGQGALERAKPYREQASALESSVEKRRVELLAKVEAYRAARGGSLIPTAQTAPGAR
ncbi:MAG: protein kinase domain-containing protein [Phycisphaerales bacterium]